MEGPGIGRMESARRRASCPRPRSSVPRRARGTARRYLDARSGAAGDPSRQCRRSAHSARECVDLTLISREMAMQIRSSVEAGCGWGIDPNG